MPTAAAPERLYRYDRIAEVHPYSGAVTPEQVAAYRRDGYVAFDAVLTPAEVEEARAALADLINGRVPGYEGLQPEPEFRDEWPFLTAAERADRVRKVFRFADHEARLKRLGVEHPAVQRILTTLLGEPARMIQDMALLKPPHVGTEKPWHQDMAYFAWGPPEKVIGVWIALDPATAENGCMHVLPGTHREGPTAHVHARDCQIPDERVDVARDVMVPLRPGGALFFASLLHHGTPPNRSASRRWALQYHYAAASAEAMDRQRHADLYFEGDLYAGCRGQMGVPVTELQP